MTPDHWYPISSISETNFFAISILLTPYLFLRFTLHFLWSCSCWGATLSACVRAPTHAASSPFLLRFRPPRFSLPVLLFLWKNLTMDLNRTSCLLPLAYDLQDDIRLFWQKIILLRREDTRIGFVWIFLYGSSSFLLFHCC